MKKLSVFLLVFVVFAISSYAEQLRVTPEHPFYLNGEWVEAKDLKIGDKLKTIDGKTAVIRNIRKVETNEPITVYNLEDDYYLHNYVVSKGLVVHNSNKPWHKNPLVGDIGDDPMHPYLYRYNENRIKGKFLNHRRRVIHLTREASRRLRLSDSERANLDQLVNKHDYTKGDDHFNWLSDKLDCLARQGKGKTPEFKGYLNEIRELTNLEWHHRPHMAPPDVRRDASIVGVLDWMDSAYSRPSRPGNVNIPTPENIARLYKEDVLTGKKHWESVKKAVGSKMADELLEAAHSAFKWAVAEGKYSKI